MSYQYVNVRIFDLLANILSIIVMGIPLEGFHGHLRLVLLFNIGVIAGACGHMLTNIHSSGLVGMSAGCYALIGVHIADLIMNWRRSRYRKVKLVLLTFFLLLSMLGSLSI